MRVCGHASSAGQREEHPGGRLQADRNKSDWKQRFTPRKLPRQWTSLGATADDEVFRKAARQLGETGAFNNIAYSFTYSSRAPGWHSRSTDADKFVPALQRFRLVTVRSSCRRCMNALRFSAESCPLADACPIKSPTFCRPCWWKMASPANVEYLRTPVPGGGQLASID